MEGTGGGVQRRREEDRARHLGAKGRVGQAGCGRDGDRRRGDRGEVGIRQPGFSATAFGISSGVGSDTTCNRQ